MAHQLRNYLMCGIIGAGLMTSAVWAGDTEDTLVRAPLFILLGAGAVGLSIGIYRYVSSSIAVRLTAVEGGVQKVDGSVQKLDKDLATFRTETESNFCEVLGGQATLVKVQEKLKDTVIQVDAQVSGARKEIEGVRDIVVATQTDVTNIKERAIKLQQQMEAIQDKLKRHDDKLANIQATMATKCDITKIQVSITEISRDLENLTQIVLTKGHMAEIKTIVKDAVREEIDERVARHTEYRQLSVAPESSKPVPALPAPRTLLKQTA